MEGNPHYFILDVVPILDDKRSIICTVGTLRDISEMKTQKNYYAIQKSFPS